MAVFVIWDDEDPLKPPMDIGAVIECVKVLNDLPSVAHACAILFGLIYVLNLSYPSELKFTFEAPQEIFVEVEPKKMTRRVFSQALNIGFIREKHLDTACSLFYFIASIQICSRIIKGVNFTNNIQVLSRLITIFFTS